MQNILVVDDESDIRQVTKLALSSAGYIVHEAANGSLALEVLNKPDAPIFSLIILDVTMPVMDGIETCKILKGSAATASIPIIMLSAKSSELEKVLGLEAGADDYLAKPFGIMELLARVKARLRNRNLPNSNTEINKPASKALYAYGSIQPEGRQLFGDLMLDFSHHEAFCGEEKIALSPTEFELLQLLFTNPHKTFSRDELMNSIWGTEFIGESRLVDQHVKNLRAKLSKFPSLKNIIQTVRNLGYRAADL